MKEIDFDLENNPFIGFVSSRYSVSAKLNVKNMWIYSKENDLSFFTLSLAALMDAVNRIPEFKRRIIDGKVIEYDYLEGVCPIMDEKNKVFKEMRVKTPDSFEKLIDWHDYVQKLEKDILAGNAEDFTLDMLKRDQTNIANFSCIPWIDFDSITTAISTKNQIQPLLTWGKVNDDYEMTVALTVNHIFVNGKELANFYQLAQENFENCLGLK